MSCTFYYWNGGYACRKTGKNVDEDIYYKYCRNYDYDDCPIYKGNDSSGGCFLTSACVETRGLADNCHELTVLRSFRDTYLKCRANGEADISEYYRYAPTIVERINSSSNKDAELDGIYEKLVLPCVNDIENGQMESAYERYSAYFRMLKDKYNQ